jgi:predicted helicase
MPDSHGDWLKQRDVDFTKHLILGDKSAAEPALFDTYSLGVNTNRDAWARNPSKVRLSEQMKRMIAFYNAEVSRFETSHRSLDRKARAQLVDSFINTDTTKIGWTVNLKTELIRGTHLAFDESRIVPSLYRPFFKEWLYFDRKLNERVLQIPRLFPVAHATNRVIGVSSGESRAGFSVIMTDVVPSLHAADMVGSQFFPLYIYDSDGSDADADSSTSLFPAPKKKKAGPMRRDGITDAGLAHFQAAYPGKTITKEDIFYYVYGILHSADYRERYADNLGKELPRIPRVKKAGDFWAFSRAGRTLGDLHVGFEQVGEYSALIEGPTKPTGASYRVEKMKFGKGKDKSVIHYNDFITVRDIPLEAYEYVVNGKSAIEWVMERQSVTTDKASGIVKDANAWANETVREPRYPLSLLLRVITVSLETKKIVNSLPALEILDESASSIGTSTSVA